MTTKFLTINFLQIFQILLSWNFPGKTAFLDDFPSNFRLPEPLQYANFINIVVSASPKKKQDFIDNRKMGKATRNLCNDGAAANGSVTNVFFS